MKKIISIVFTLLALPSGQSVLAAGQNPGDLYRTECGACHVPYPAVFLPGTSWDKLLGNLSDHFGDNAELDPEALKSIQGYLAEQNFDHSSIKRRYGNRFDTPGEPLRVTKTRFFGAIHREIPARLVKDNPKVGTFAKCDVCHRDAQYGSFDEDNVHIPR